MRFQVSKYPSLTPLGESTKLVELLKDKIKNGLTTMEGGINAKLRNKVEFDVLKDMSQNIDNKLNSEISQKIDKKELKVKTAVINKKVI